MLLKKRTIVAVAVGWLTVVFAIAAIAVTATAATTGATIDDVQIGKRGNLTRIALICTPACNLGADEDGDFILHGVFATMKVDLSSRSDVVRSFATIPGPQGSHVKIFAADTVVSVEDKDCRVGGRAASCIDLTFAGNDAGRVEKAPDAATPSKPSATPQKPASSKSVSNRQTQKTNAAVSLAEASQAATAPKTTPASPIAPKPALREAAPERFASFAGLEPPERLSPPATPMLASLRPVPTTVTAPSATPAPTIRVAPRGLTMNFEQDAVRILGRVFDEAECAAAETTLLEDAWALSSMSDLGFCRAIAGDFESADGIFSRLLEYTPDNYSALVGRALIAAKAGESAAAKRYFQDALNALPPIAESNRIVDAMASL